MRVSFNPADPYWYLTRHALTGPLSDHDKPTIATSMADPPFLALAPTYGCKTHEVSLACV
jgi:hypothetical protein